MPEGNIWMVSLSVQHYAYQPRSQPRWIAPLLTRCWRYVLMKKGDDEEGAHVHWWLPKERITAAYYYIKQLGGPCSPQIMGDASPVMTQYGDAYWLQPAPQHVACFPWGHCANSDEMFCGEIRWEDRRDGYSTEGGMVQSLLIKAKLSFM